MSDRIAAAAHAARRALEELLDALGGDQGVAGWPADERAISGAIDRCVQLEDGK